MKSRLHRFLVVPLLSIFCFLVCSCEEEKLRESDRQEFHTIINTGSNHPDDPFVRAETMRVLELLEDPGLNEFARARLTDSSPMVRTAALRVLLVTNAPGARSAALNAFTSSRDREERRTILNAALDYGSPPLKRAITKRAQRGDDPVLQELAFRRGPIARVDAALAEENTDYLERTLYPELGKFITVENPLLAAAALEKLLEVGQADRAAPLIETLEDEKAPLEKRLKAAKILAGAHATPAAPSFKAILEQHEAAMADSSLGVPKEKVDPALLRAAILGMVATNDVETVKTAQKYLTNASVEESIEVLQALGRNPAEDAAISLKIAMQDARDPVRFRAIELYSIREDAEPKALIEAMRSAPQRTRERLSDVLLQRFREAWVEHLKSSLLRPSTVDDTLQLLKEVIVTEEEIDMLRSLQDELRRVSEDEKPRRAALATYLLAQTVTPEERDRLVAEKLDDSTRYAYLEFLVRIEPEEGIETFRSYFNYDMFAIRLMSGAGLWSALGGEELKEDGVETTPPESAEPATEDEPEQAD